MRRFLDYYRQFEELSPAEVSRRLRDQAAERRRRAPAEIEPLDLTATTWHEPPHAEAVNAATFALRRALNRHPDPDARGLREALAARHGVAPAQVIVGHGAGELLQAACHALLTGGGELLVAWPGWHALPRLAERAGGRPVPVALDAAGAPDLDALLAAVGRATRAVALCSPNDPTGAALAPAELRAFLARVPEHVTVLLDEALAEFREPGADAVALLAEAPRLLIVRSFSKAHALAGLRVGYALTGPGSAEWGGPRASERERRGPRERVAAAARWEGLGPPPGVAETARSEGLGPPQGVAAAARWERLGALHGISAPAQAAAQWAVEHGEPSVARRRAAVARDRERLVAALAGSPVHVATGRAPFAWLSVEGLSARELTARLAASKVFVAPGAAWGDERHVRAALRGPQAVDRLADTLLHVSDFKP